MDIIKMFQKQISIGSPILFAVSIFFIVWAGSVYHDIKLYFVFFLIGCGFLLLWGYFRGYFSDRAKWSDPEVGKDYCKKILSFCREELCFLAGEGNSEFMEDIQIIQAMDELVKDKSKRIRFLFGPHYDVRSATLLRWAKEGRVEMRWVNTRIKGEHFKIVDKMYLQISYEHEPLEKEREGYTAYSLWEANIKWRKFEKLWEEAEVFDVEKRIKEAEEKYNKFKEEYEKEGDEKHKESLKWKGCEWGLSAGFIKKEKGKKNPVPATQEDIIELKEKVLKG
jgi:hypothetical protein